MKKLVLTMVLLIAFSCTQSKFEKEWTQEKAPKQFTARFETTKGEFDIAITRNLSPHAADRLYQLINHGYFDNAIFYRVVPDFVAQFGNTDTLQMKLWRSVKVPDENVILSNTKGTVSFARLGKDSRDLELFINLNDNTVLDTLHFEGVKGFPALGSVSKGMNIVEQLYGGYGETTMTDDNLYGNRSAFQQSYPKLDLIKKAYIVE